MARDVTDRDSVSARKGAAKEGKLSGKGPAKQLVKAQ